MSNQSDSLSTALRFVMGVTALLLSVTSFSKTESASELKEVVIALKPDKNPEKMLEERGRLEKVLSQNLKRPVKVIIPTTSSVILEGFANGTIDLGYLSSLDMVNAERAKLAEQLLAGKIKGKNSYESLWLVKADSKFKTIGDLKGKPVAFSSRTSTSGYLIPVWNLIKKGQLQSKQDPEMFFGRGNAWYGSGYVTAVQRVLDGTAEAAAVSDYVFIGDKHLTPEQKSQLRILQSQGPVPTHVVGVRSSLSADQKKLLKRALLSLNAETNLRDQVFTSELVEVSPREHLASTREALEITGIEIKTQ